MHMRKVGAGATLLVTLVSCGGSKPPPVVATAQPAKERTPLEAAPLTPVTAPPELFAVARFRNPAKTTDQAIGWSALPVDWRAELRKEVPGIDAVVTYDAPVDFAAMLDPSSGEEPNAFWAVALGVQSVDSTVGFLRQQGANAVGDSAGGYTVRVDAKLTCSVSRALGAAPARLVCSDSAASVDALGPYLTRGLPLETLGKTSDVHAHVVAEPFRRRYGSQLALVRTVGVPFALRELQVDSPKLDRALRDVLYGLADELVALAYDVDRIDVDGTFEPSGDIASFSMQFGFVGKRSWTAQTMAHVGEHPGPAPDFFWKLPADVTSAGYGAYSDPDRFRGVAAAVRELVDGFLDYKGLPDKRRTPLVDALEQALTIGGKSAYATLPIPETEPTAKRPEDAIKATLGAHLFGVEQGGDRLMKLCSEFVKSLGDPALRAQLAKMKSLADNPLPVAKERAPKSAKGLPPGTRVYELDLAKPERNSDEEEVPAWLGERGGKKKAKAKTPQKLSHVNVVVVAAPDGPLTWFGFGTDEQALTSRIAALHANSGPNLSTRTGLEALHTDSSLSSGFSTLAEAGAQFLPLLAAVRTKDAALPKMLGRLPHRGETPMPWRVSVDPAGPKATWQSRVPKAVVEDAVAAIVGLAGDALTKTPPPSGPLAPVPAPHK